MIEYLVMVAVPVIIFYWYGNMQNSSIYENQVELFEKRKNKRALTAFFLIYFLLLACRHWLVGIDTSVYLYYFDNVSGETFVDALNNSELESGFVVYMSLISRITKNHQWYMAITAALIVIPIYILYKKESDNAILSISLFITNALFSMFFSGIRQSLAVAMTVPVYYCVKHKKLLLYLLFVAIAYSFHQSALILLVMYPLYHSKITSKWLMVAIPAMILVYVFNAQIFTFLLPIMGGKYEKYNVQTTNAYTMLILYVIFIIYSYVIIDEKKIDKDTLGMRNFLLFTTFLQCFTPISPMTMRLSYYYILLIPLLISRVAMRCRKEVSQIASISVIIMCCYFIFYFFNNAIRGEDGLRIFPYFAFWELN